MRLLYVGDASSPNFAGWVSFFARRGHDVHVCHLFETPAQPFEGIALHPAPAPMRWRARGAWRATALGLRGLARRLRPDVVHSHGLWPSSYLVSLARLRPHVATAYGSEVLRASTSRERAMVRRVARTADLITANAEVLLHAVREAGADPARLRLVSWGVDPAWAKAAAEVSREEAARRLGLPLFRPLVLAPRGTRPVYRAETVIRAIALVREEVPEVLALVACDEGPDAVPGSFLRKLAVRLGCGESILFEPKHPHAEMPIVLRAAAVCVSVPESDGAPVTALEAMALGVPLVVSDLPWVHEPSFQDARMDVVPVGDPETLAAAILRRLRCPDPETVEANRRLVAERFDRNRLLPEVEAAYEALAR